MDFVLYNLRLKELVAVVQENKQFFDDFVTFLNGEGYGSVLEFIQEPADEKAIATIERFLARQSDVKLYDGLLRPYTNSKAKWYFLAWRDGIPVRADCYSRILVRGSGSVEI